MKTRIAIIAACVGGLGLAQAGLAQAAPIVIGHSNIVPHPDGHPSDVTASGAANQSAFKFYKLDSAFTSQACKANKGAVVKNGAGQLACRSSNPIPHASEFVSFNFAQIKIQD